MTLRKLRDAVIVMTAFLALIWTLQVVNVADGYHLDTEFSILPQNLSRLPDILSAPFLHFSWQHIEGNSVPLFVLGVLAAYRSVTRFLLVSLILARQGSAGSGTSAVLSAACSRPGWYGAGHRPKQAPALVALAVLARCDGSRRAEGPPAGSRPVRGRPAGSPAVSRSTTCFASSRKKVSKLGP
jgi:membrane associated rhomboid family serine protease